MGTEDSLHPDTMTVAAPHTDAPSGVFGCSFFWLCRKPDFFIFSLTLKNTKVPPNLTQSGRQPKGCIP